MDGQSPYDVINPEGKTSFLSGYLYPLPAALILSPLAFIEVRAAMVVFSGISVAALAFVFMGDGYWRLPLVLSFPVYWSAVTGQWAPLMTAAALTPALGWIAAAKPTLGFASFVYRPSTLFAALAAVLVVISLIAQPSWPWEWLREIGQREAVYYRAPIALPGGFVLMLAALRWRRPEARTLLVMSALPQTMLFYDQLPLALVASTFRQATIMAVVSWVAPFAAMAALGEMAAPLMLLLRTTAPIILLLYYGPVLVLVLSRPNIGEVPAWIDRLSAFVPPWLRGSQS